MSHTAAGQLHLINYTGVAWIRKDISSKGMEKWDFSFPETIIPDSTAVVPIQFRWSLFKPLEDESGQVVYELEGTGQTFIINATGIHGRCEVYVDYNDVPVLSSSAVDWVLNPQQPAIAFPPKSHYDLCWGTGETQDYICELHRSTVKGFYTNNIKMGMNFPIDSSNWMSQYYSFLKDTPLNQILLPGSQDSGCTEVAYGSKYGVCDANFVTQLFDFEHQLKFGARFFDLKPCHRDSKWRLGHYYKHTPDDSFGGEGISLDNMITTINQFTQNHNELIVLYINDPTIIATQTYNSSIDHYQSLFFELRELNFLYKGAPEDVENITNLPLSTFLHSPESKEGEAAAQPTAFKPNKPCVLIVVDETSDVAVQNAAELSKQSGTPYPGISIPANSGIFSTKNRFLMAATRSLSQDPLEVINEQLSNLDSSPVPESLYPHNRMVLMNWSVIQSTNDAFWTGIGLWNRQCSILNQAQKMRYLLHTLFASLCSLRDRYPNIVMVDSYDDSVVRSVLTVNLLQGLKRFQNWSEHAKRPFWGESAIGRQSIAAEQVARPVAAAPTPAPDVVEPKQEEKPAPVAVEIKQEEPATAVVETKQEEQQPVAVVDPKEEEQVQTEVVEPIQEENKEDGQQNEAFEEEPQDDTQ